MAKFIVSNNIIVEKWPGADLSQFVHPNPKYYENQRLGFSNFGVPQTIRLYDETDSHFIFPRGLISQLFQLRPDFEIIDQTVNAPVEFPSSKIIPKLYQTPAIEAMLQRNQGLLIAPPGAGKTNCGIEVIIKRKQKSLVLVHTIDLLNQWLDRFKQFTDITPGVINGDRWDIRPITIGTIQSLNRPLDGHFLNKWGCVAADEAHHIPANSFRKVISQFPAQYRYGLTATLERRDGLSFIACAVLGNTICEIKSDQLYEADEIIKPKVVAFHTNFFSSDADTYGKMIEAITQDEDRNSLILNKVTDESKNGHSCLVLTNRVKHAQLLHQSLKGGTPTACLTSKTAKPERGQILDKMNSGELKVLFATTLADEGLDVPRLSRLFLTAPGRSVSKVRQQVGRIQRTFPGKTDAIVFDIYDPLCSLAASQFHTRRKKVYEEQGFDVQEVPYAVG